MVVNVKTPAAVSIDRQFTEAGFKLFSAQYSILNFNDASVLINGIQLIEQLLAAGAKVGKVTEIEVNYYGTVNATAKILFTNGDGIVSYVGGVVCLSPTDYYSPDSFPVSLPMALRSGADDWSSMIGLVCAGYGATDDMHIMVRGEIYR